MLGETLSTMTSDADGITFEVERWATAPGRVEVSGRWFGVRGRRFARPTLTLVLIAGGAEQRILADLEHKPWAAEDGEPWRASFPLDGGLPAATRIELNVAPDITIELAPDGDGAKAARAAGRRPPVSSAANARSPVIRDDPARPRPRAARTPEVERLHERLALAESVITRERSRRAAANGVLDEERRSVRTLQAEVGRLRAELELAKTVQQERETTEAALDRLRRESRENGREREQITSHRDAARRELAAERAETERLRSQLADAEAAVRRLTQAGHEARSGADSKPDQAEPETTERMPRPVSEPGGRSQPAARDVLHGEMHERASLLPRTERPLNPSLRTSNWLGRGLALIVIAIVVVAIVVVINSTVH